MRRALAALLLLGAITACDDVAAPVTLPAPESAAPSADDGLAPAPATRPSTVDPCALVTKAEAEALAGLAMQDAVAAPESCRYTSPPTGTTGQVEVYIGDGAKKQLDIERQLGHELVPLDGAGDEAYTYVDGLTVYVSKGGVWTSLHLVRIDDPARYRAPLEELARTMSTRY